MVLSCTREQRPSPGTENQGINATVSIVAKIEDDDFAEVKTTYDETYANPKFAWLDGDMITVQLEKREGVGHSKHTFTTSGGDLSATFDATAGIDLTTYKLSTFAIYPRHTPAKDWDLDYDITNNDVYLKKEITVSKADLKAIVPLIGTKNSATEDNATSGVLYNFKTPTGVIRLSLKNVPASAKKVQLVAKSASDYISGYVGLTAMEDGEISMGDIYYDRTPSKTIIFNFTPTEGEDLIVYMPIPTGTLTGGFTVKVLGNDDAEILGCSISQDVEIERNNIYFVPDITFDSNWLSLGTGWFGDNYQFYKVSKAGCMAAVDIQQNKVNPNQYRVRDPYGVAASQLGFSLGGFHNAYFTFTIDGENVSFVDHKTGIQWNDSGNMKNVMAKYVSSTKNSVVYDSYTPKLVRLSPKYYSETDSGNKTYENVLSDRSTSTNMINIVFPGYSIGEVLAGDWRLNGLEAFWISMNAITDENYNVAITRYVSSAPYDISGTCKGIYNPKEGTLVFPQQQAFADTGETMASGEHAGEKIYWSFRSYPTSGSSDLTFNMVNQNGFWNNSSTNFWFDKYCAAYNSTAGYMQSNQHFSGPNLQKQ